MSTPAKFITSGYVIAKTYSEAIEKFGAWMDELWENGTWSVLSCKVEQGVMTQTGEVLSWHWWFEAEWKGIKP